MKIKNYIIFDSSTGRFVKKIISTEKIEMTPFRSKARLFTFDEAYNIVRLCIPGTDLNISRVIV